MTMSGRIAGVTSHRRSGLGWLITSTVGDTDRLAVWTADPTRALCVAAKCTGIDVQLLSAAQSLSRAELERFGTQPGRAARIAPL